MNLDAKRVQPGVPVYEDACSHPWVFVLSDWLDAHSTELGKRVKALFDESAGQKRLPLIFIVNDLEKTGPAVQQLLENLTESGAFVLEAEEEERAALRSNPLVFAAHQFQVAAQGTVPSPPGFPSTAQAPTNSDGYKEFAKALTRLSAKDLEDLIASPHSPAD